MITIAVYGSLKKGKYNHGLLADSEYVGETTLSGTLYRVSSYPALVEEGNNEYPAEVYKVSEEVYNLVKSMEIGAGYKEVDIDGNKVYYADTFLAEHCQQRCEEISSY